MIGILASEAPNGNFIPGDVNELYWGSISFGIIFVVFLMKGVPRIKVAMQARTARIEAELAAAAVQKADAQAELATLSGQLGDADAEAAKIVADAREQAIKLEADLLVRAKADMVDSKERSRIEILAQREQALADLREAVAERARTAADAVVRDNLDDSATQSALIDDYISQLAG
ncbi:MAG: F-type H+-transporting ATPase subunit b [Candidatus Aldehydirespiratoraceae bacterium]|jgi:F-type H+-transporting ATPase subunit b